MTIVEEFEQLFIIPGLGQKLKLDRAHVARAMFNKNLIVTTTPGRPRPVSLETTPDSTHYDSDVAASAYSLEKSPDVVYPFCVHFYLMIANRSRCVQLNTSYL